MNLNILTPQMERVPAIDEIIHVASGLTTNFTRNVFGIANSTMKLLNSPANDTNSATISPPLSDMSDNSGDTTITTTTARHWLLHEGYLVNSSYAFLTNLSYTKPHVYVPASTLPAIEDDEIRLEHAPQLSKSAMIKVYVLSLMALFSLLGNVLTMWNIYKTRMARRNSRHSWSAIYSLIFHLSIADVLVTGFCIIGEAAWCYTVQWLANELTCKLVKLFQMFSLYLSTYVLVLIGIDRWIAVKYPMKSLNMAKRCYRLLGGTYILSFILSLPQFFIFHVARGPFVEEFYQCVTHGFYTAEWQEQLYATFTLVFTFLLPLCILFGSYMSTFRTISSSEKMFQGSKLADYTNKPSSKTNRQRLIHKAKMKSLRISVVIIIAFLICWTPYNVMMLIFMFWNPDKRFGEDLQSAIFFFGMSNSLVNPLIYGAFHLCPMKRKTSKKGNNNNGNYSLNRGDSQRTPSMLTAVTQIDCNGRQVRTYRQPSYYRSISTGSNYKENIGLLQTPTNNGGGTPTPGLIRKSASMRSPHPNQRSMVHTAGSRRNFNQPLRAGVMDDYDNQRQYHNHSSEIILNDNSSNDAGPVVVSEGQAVSIVLSYDNQRGGVAAMKRSNTGSISPTAAPFTAPKNGYRTANNLSNTLGIGPATYGNCGNDSVSSV
ncbi:gonadotropin-releasing hormone receptor [Musca domestica]|uniref:Gonadotropin-releasing hormone receptor n=1 Tax=Musca domestica TaxID=7370 RepID=A0ABM3UQ24_MUSDO|nr:gonadotropin-releasing hormone receptor [Musca domestica]XP_058975635.1 gonadotropin-releasing hormone receptor [Musca domestica]